MKRPDTKRFAADIAEKLIRRAVDDPDDLFDAFTEDDAHAIADELIALADKLAFKADPTRIVAPMRLDELEQLGSGAAR